MRYLSFTFDDGMIYGAKESSKIFEKFNFNATYFIVPGWVKPSIYKISEQYNENVDHGTWSDIIELKNKGHEIGSHTMLHINAAGKKARFIPLLLQWNINQSFKKISYEIEKPYTLSMPWNARSMKSNGIAKKKFKIICSGDTKISYNNLKSIDWLNIRSWAPDSDVSLNEFSKAINDIPDDGWLILQFHSLNEEGYMPITSEKLYAISQIAKNMENLKVITIKDLYKKNN